MEKRELAIPVSSTLAAFGAAEVVANGSSTADSWGITRDTALIDAYSNVQPPSLDLRRYDPMEL